MGRFIQDVFFLSFVLPSTTLAWSFSSATDALDNFDDKFAEQVDRIDPAESVDSRLPAWLPR